MDYDLLVQVLNREAKATARYLDAMPKRPPGGRAKGKTAGWRHFREMVVDHKIKSDLTLSGCVMHKRMGM